MNARRAPYAAAVVMLAVALGLWRWCDHRRALHENARLACERRLAALAAREVLDRKQAPSRQTSDPGGPTPANKAKAGSKSFTTYSAGSRLQNNPALQAAYFAGKRAGVAAAYGPLIRKLHLPPEQVARLAQLITDREERVFDAAATSPELYKAMTTFDGTDHARLVINPYDAQSYSAGRVQPVPSGSDLGAAAAAVVEQSSDTFRAAATELLGPDGFAQLEDYERVLPAQSKARDLAADLALTDEPLTIEQADRLVQLLAEATPTFQAGGDAIPQWISWDQVASNLPTLLSPAQMADLRYTLEYNQSSQHADQLETQFFKQSAPR